MQPQPGPGFSTSLTSFTSLERPSKVYRGQWVQRSPYCKASQSPLGLSGRAFNALLGITLLRPRRLERKHVFADEGGNRPAKKLPNYMVRILAGVILGEIMGPATFAGGWPFLFAYTAVVYLISVEYSRLTACVLEPPPVRAQKWALFLVSASILLAAHCRVLTGIFECAAVTLLVLLLLLQGNIRPQDGSPPISFSHIASQVFGVFYVGSPIVLDKTASPCSSSTRWSSLRLPHWTPAYHPLAARAKHWMLCLCFMCSMHHRCRFLRLFRRQNMGKDTIDLGQPKQDSGGRLLRSCGLCGNGRALRSDVGLSLRHAHGCVGRNCHLLR